MKVYVVLEIYEGTNHYDINVFKKEEDADLFVNESNELAHAYECEVIE